VEKEIILAFKDAGEVITLILSVVAIFWMAIKFGTLLVKKWSEAATMRNATELKRIECDEKLATAHERLAATLETVAVRMETLTESQRQITLSLQQLGTQQADTDRDMKAGFTAAADQVSAEGTQTRDQLTSGFGQVGEGMDDLSDKLTEVAAQNAAQHDAILANMADLKQQIGVLMQRTDVPAGWRDQLTALISVSNKLWSGMQALMARADVQESTEPPVTRDVSQVDADEAAPSVPEMKES